MDPAPRTPGGRRWAALLAPALVMSLLFGCSGSEPASTVMEVRIFTRDVGVEREAFQAAFAGFTGRTGIHVSVTGNANFETTVDQRIASHQADMVVFPQPGRIRDSFDRFPPLDPDVARAVRTDFPQQWVDLVTDGEQVKAVPVSAEVKSLIWYSPQVFKDRHIEKPTTLEGFEKIIREASAAHQKDGDPSPLCIGLKSGTENTSSGWPFTDWVEDYLLRIEPFDVYDRWARLDPGTAFNDARVVDVAARVRELWFTPNAVRGGVPQAAGLDYQEAGRAVLTGQCLMYHQGNYYAANFSREDYTSKKIDAFVLPGREGGPKPILTAGNFAVLVGGLPPDREAAARQVMAHLADVEFAEARTRLGGYLSPNLRTRLNLYPSRLEQRNAKILRDAVRDKLVRFDASDTMPAGTGTTLFWSKAMAIALGNSSVREAFDAVENERQK
jgi:alpha-glucoside transport system substrate-binding protein